MIKSAYSLMGKLTAKSNWLQSAALLAVRLWIAKVFSSCRVLPRTVAGNSALIIGY